MKIRKRLASSKTLNKFAASLLSGYLRFCYATTRWEREGFEEMDALLRAGKPVIIVLWHERICLSPYMFDTQLGKICGITTKSRIAYLLGLVLQHFNAETITVDPKARSPRANREILDRIRNGYSIAISPDGTRGPPRVAKPFPILWARRTDAPIFFTTFSMKRALRLRTWDRTLIPLPFNSGALLARRWDVNLQRAMPKEQIEELTSQLEAELNGVTMEADTIVGRTD